MNWSQWLWYCLFIATCVWNLIKHACRVTSTSWAAVNWIAWSCTPDHLQGTYTKSSLVGCNDIILCSVVYEHQLQKIQLKCIHCNHKCMPITFSCIILFLVHAISNLFEFGNSNRNKSYALCLCVCGHPITKIVLLTYYA